MLDLIVDTPVGASKVISEGTLVLEQNEPVLIESQVNTLFNKDPLTDANFARSSIQDIRREYSSRKVRIGFDTHTFV